ncbi:GNAT family N-acetyltransferase [Streptococcus caballi]|uniref:GNAT family N-acetyltransferase n=1 Tax=Streptococcus caballi TaxID=439220 RepID=UPI003B8370C0
MVGTCNCSAFRKLRLAHRAEIGISVKKDYLGKGIGRQLLMETIAKVRQANIKLLSLEVGSDSS